MTEELHPSRLRILEFLARRDPTEGPPAVREVGEAVGLKSSQTVHHHLLGLEESGYVERGRIPWPQAAPFEAHREGLGRGLNTSAAGQDRRRTRSRSNSERGALLSGGRAPDTRSGRALPPGGQGRLHDGRRHRRGGSPGSGGEPSPPDGSVVAALVLGKEEEATVKVLRRRGGTVRLEARNGAHEDIVVPADRVIVQGTVEWVIRRVRGRR